MILVVVRMILCYTSMNYNSYFRKENKFENARRSHSSSAAKNVNCGGNIKPRSSFVATRRERIAKYHKNKKSIIRSSWCDIIRLALENTEAQLSNALGFQNEKYVELIIIHMQPKDFPAKTL